MNALDYYLIIMRLLDTVSKLGMFRVGLKINMSTNMHFISGTNSHMKIYIPTHTNIHTHKHTQRRLYKRVRTTGI